MATKNLKRKQLRYNEYYNMQQIFDDLYDKSKNKPNYRFFKLMDIITKTENIELAYRSIKRNTGSNTKGTDSVTIKDLEVLTIDKIVKEVQSRLANYSPSKVRRVLIPKPYSDKKRPLGIPCMWDRLIQQCIKQVLEPICEAKFYNHSYGFRPNRSCQDALARCSHLMQLTKLHYVVDIDIKGFFDNVNHEKLMKQIWNLGIQDKQLLCIIGKMLKSPIDKEGIPTKGTPQGGILSPLLSNIVLNELDWWIANQWEYMQTNKDYSRVRDNKGTPRIDNSHKYRALKTTNLKEIYIVRYADDFKIFCRDYNTASKIFIATKNWLKERLGLDISPEKSKIVNLKTNYSEYLGIKLKVTPKRNKFVLKSHMSDSRKEKAIKTINDRIDTIGKDATPKNVNLYNSTILGIQNYYKTATNINKDCKEIYFRTLRHQYNRLKDKSKNQKFGHVQNKSKCYEKYYGDYNIRETYVAGTILFPIYAVTTKHPLGFDQNICSYTEKGRMLIHKKLTNVSTVILNYLLENPVGNQSMEYNDNRISLYVAQNGKDAITGKPLEIGKMHCHHKLPKSKGGTDVYKNLIFISDDIHILIHATVKETIRKYLEALGLDSKMIDKVNKLRLLVGNEELS